MGVPSQVARGLVRGRRWINLRGRCWSTLGGFTSFFLSYSFSVTPDRTNISMGRFKTAPGLVAAFEARRLPRSFLVLFESLLNKTPAARPSCERSLQRSSGLGMGKLIQGKT